MLEAFKLGYAAGLGVLAAAATGLILWGLYDIAGGIIYSVWLTYRQWRQSKVVDEDVHKEVPLA